MPMSDRHKLIFIHIAKNAGTSVMRALDMRNTGHHNFYLYYRDKFPSQWQEYRKFAVIRNPWDRFVSSYEYAKMSESHWHSMRGRTIFGPHPDYEKIKNLSFEECALALLNDTGRFEHPSWLVQKNYIHDGERIVVDTIINYENIAEEMFTLLGVKLPVLNKSHRSCYQSYYNEKTIRIIAELYKEDIALFNCTYERHDR
jgi:hypothetical protein